MFVAKRIPSMGYATYDISSERGEMASTLRSGPSVLAANSRFAISLNGDGSIRSIRDKAANRELVNADGERNFNDLLRVEGPDASKVSYPVTPTVAVRRGVQMTEIIVHRDRSFSR